MWGEGFLQKQFLRHLQGLWGRGAVMMTSDILFINAKSQLGRSDRFRHFMHLLNANSLSPPPTTAKERTSSDS